MHTRGRPSTTVIQLHARYDAQTHECESLVRLSLDVWRYAALWCSGETFDIHVKLPEHAKYVLRGGHLLHVVCWPTSSTYKQVCDVYVAYTLHHYGAQPVVVFDDHDNSTSTKNS